MRKPLHSSPALRTACLLSLAAISLLAGCGELRRWYEARKESANPHSVTIAWTASASSVEGYNVYRATPPGPPVKLSLRIIPGTRYTDTTVEPGHTYSYFVTSVDFKGTESTPSGDITVTVPATVTPRAKD